MERGKGGGVLNGKKKPAPYRAVRFIFSYQYSKFLIFGESAMVYYSTWRVLNFCEMSIENNYLGSLPFLTTLIGAIWGAYGASVAFYYGKGKAEEVEKIKLGSGQGEPGDKEI